MAKTQARIFYEQAPNKGQSPEQLVPFRDRIFKALIDEDDSLQDQIDNISGGGGVQSVSGSTVDNTDPLNPVVNAGAGDIKSDGTVDFVAPELWDDSLGDTTQVRPDGITIIDTTTIPGTTYTTYLTDGYVYVSDGSGYTSEIHNYGIQCNNPVGDTSALYGDYIAQTNTSSGQGTCQITTRVIRKSLTTAEIQGLFSNGLSVAACLITPTGALVPVSCAVKYNYNATAFTNTRLYLLSSGQSIGDHFMETRVFLTNVGNINTTMIPNTTGLPILVAGQDLVVVADADSVLGDGTIDLYIEFKEFNLI